MRSRKLSDLGDYQSAALKGFNEAGSVRSRKPSPTASASTKPNRFNEAGSVRSRKRDGVVTAKPQTVQLQ